MLVCAVTDEREVAENDRALEARVQALAHQIAEAINADPTDGREALRDAAIALLRDEVQTAEIEPPLGTPAGAAPAGAFNPFGIGIPLILMGGVMVFLFPPVGLLMFAAAAVMLAWGVGTTLLARS